MYVCSSWLEFLHIGLLDTDDAYSKSLKFPTGQKIDITVQDMS